ncbi:MAG: hypothetical protein H6Q90_392 [Deltaproteobacteria bacterium]|nr:hypothetical protein [Deltaproteobacteria bacterium]
MPSRGHGLRPARDLAGVDTLQLKIARTQRVSIPIVGGGPRPRRSEDTALFAHVDTASLARDLRPHLTFAAPSGTVTSLDPTAGAHVVHTIDTDAADPGHK